jgi:hypothetical protein
MEKIRIIGDSEIIVDCRQDAVSYESGHYVVDLRGIPIYTKNYNDYVAFIISDQVAQGLYDELDWTCDEVWIQCIEYAKEFEVSDLNTDEKSLYDCVQDFIDNVVNEEGKIK